jgi:hypothetical protein
MKTEQEVSRFCDGAITRAAEVMMEEGATAPMVLDRVFTFAVAHSCKWGGTFPTIALLKNVIEQLEAGKFGSFEPRGTRN